MIKTYTFLILVTLLCNSVFCQDRYVQKLEAQLAIAKNDTSPMLIMAALDTHFSYSDYGQDSGMYYSNQVENLGKQLQYSKFNIYKSLLRNINDDTIRVLTIIKIGDLYTTTNSDSSLNYGQQELDLARRLNYPRGEANALLVLAFANYILGDLPRSMELSLKGLQVSEKNHFTSAIVHAYDHIGNIYQDSKEYAKSLPYYYRSMNLSREINNNLMYVIGQSNLGFSYLGVNQLDSALHYSHLSYDNARKYEINDIIVWDLKNLGRVYFQQGNKALALKYLKEGLATSIERDDTKNSSTINLDLAKLYQESSQFDSAEYFARQALADARTGNYFTNIIEAAKYLSELYESTDTKEALKYSRIVIDVKDSLYNLGKDNALKNINEFDVKERQYEINTATTAYKNKLRQYILFTGLAVFLLIAFILYRNNRQKQKANKVLERTLADLKSAQSQLIQSEKMASLGELTAGIAHEIQNPLNFVNNFSEVNTELIDELKEERNKEIRDFKNEDDILNDIKENEQKINHHGKRAGDIVKGMLQHSQKSTGQKEPTNINALADEYLRLAYHGLRAKGKSFNAITKTDYDESIDKINIIPQDIGRVILNLINNAFYAVDEKKKSGIENYQPTVSVNTKKVGDKVEIKVSDNGNGIPQKIVDKIFQPFFTTKPTGQGTGLGLSLSYDIIKANGGEIKVETMSAASAAHAEKENEGTEFIIQLPIT
jgi:signal transduction histidine kinase